MKSYGIQGTFFLIQKPPEPYSPDFDELAWKKAVAVGNEIGSHSVSHRKAASMDYEACLYETSVSKKYFEAVFGRKITSFCYPYTDCPATLQAAVRKAGYHQARAGRSVRANKIVSFDEKINRYALPSVHVSEGQFYDGTIWTYIDEAMAKNSWVTLMFHAIEATESEIGTPLGWDNVTAASFEKLLQVLSSLKKKEGLKVAPFGDIAQYLRR